MSQETGICGLNHLTLSVSDLKRSILFYRDILGCRLRAEWDRGAYFEAGILWLCLSLDVPMSPIGEADYSHIAFDASPATFPALSERIVQAARLWKDNHSEGASLYFLDPDGHRLELHCGSLQSRLDYYRRNLRAGMTLY